MAKVIAQTKILSTEKTSSFKNAGELVKKIERPLGSPINGKQSGDTFEVHLTGEIQISEYNGKKSAHFLTKEGYKLAVNASFNPQTHKEGAQFTAVCREVEVERDGKPAMIKFAAFAD